MSTNPPTIPIITINRLFSGSRKLFKPLYKAITTISSNRECPMDIKIPAFAPILAVSSMVSNNKGPGESAPENPTIKEV